MVIAKLRYKDGALVFRIEGGLEKDGTQQGGLLNFTSGEIEALSESFFAWMHEQHLVFSGITGTVMEEVQR